ncbi:hypothetical protein J5N97_010155 [Dioscorea zingiberensis]|uniref:Uncharacterized protein n=1 Tax=Dioscorea zingiberensis TaxID=325984 RepID=A0A9D5HM71_9LILI|nr:hypothetical protein J5N97_010155 [Dioscorea zingiberensis]
MVLSLTLSPTMPLPYPPRILTFQQSIDTLYMLYQDEATTVAEYILAYEDLMKEITGVSELMLISFFINNLRPDIHRELLRRGLPSTLKETFALAQACEAHIEKAMLWRWCVSPYSIAPNPIPPPIQFPTTHPTPLGEPPKPIISAVPQPSDPPTRIPNPSPLTSISPPSTLFHSKGFTTSLSKPFPLPNTSPNAPSLGSTTPAPPSAIPSPPPALTPGDHHEISASYLDDPVAAPDEDPPPSLDPGDHQVISDSHPDEPMDELDADPPPALDPGDLPVTYDPNPDVKSRCTDSDMLMPRTNLTFGHAILEPEPDPATTPVGTNKRSTSTKSTKKRGPAILVNRRYVTMDRSVLVWGVVTRSGDIPPLGDAPPHQPPMVVEVAAKVLDEMLGRNVVSWNSMNCDLWEFESYEALELFLVIWEEIKAAVPRMFTSVVRASVGLGEVLIGNRLHTCVAKFGLYAPNYVSCALIDMYSKREHTQEAQWVFDGMPETIVVGRNTIIAGYALHGDSEQALCLLLMKWGCYEDAPQVFDEISDRDVINWSVLINRFKGGLKPFYRMWEEKLQPNECVFVDILIVSAHLVAMEQRLWVAEYVKEKSIRLLVRLGTALVDIYLKYHCYKEDVNIMKEMNFDAYKFLISWLRIFLNGVNKVKLKGVAYYNRLIDYLLVKGITPYVNLYHDDPPDALAKKYKGLLSPQVVVDFADYAEFCFKTLGDRVQNWTIFNEPRVVTALRYNDGKFVHGDCTNFTGGGHLAPYAIAHHLMLPHATAAIKRYREKYQARQKAQRSWNFHLRWFVHPIIYGEYPKSVQGIIKERLPKFSPKEVRMVKDSIDFVGINKYSSYYRYDPYLPPQKPTCYQSVWHVAIDYERKGVPMGPRAHSEWPYIVPWGLYKVVTYVKEHHGTPNVLLSGNRIAAGLKYFGSMTDVYERSSGTFKRTFPTSTLRTRLSPERAVMLQRLPYTHTKSRLFSISIPNSLNRLNLVKR